MRIITQKQKIILELQKIIELLDDVNTDLDSENFRYNTLDDLRTIKTWIEEQL